MLKYQLEIIGKQRVRIGNDFGQAITFAPSSSGINALSGEFTVTIEDKNVFDKLAFGSVVCVEILSDPNQSNPTSGRFTAGILRSSVRPS